MYSQNLKQLSHVAIPGFRHDVVSNLGLISYRATAIIFDEEKDPPMRQIDIARLLGHAVAYQCLSNRIAPAILRMLQQMLGEEVFQNGIDKYLSDNPSYSGKTNIEVFWTAVQAAHEEHNKYDVEHFNVKVRMEAWTTRKHYPVINATQNETVITVKTESTNTSEKEWWIPYISTTKKDPGFALFKSIQIYYRVNYDVPSLEKISNYLNFDPYIRVHILNRAQIMDDAFHFLIKGQLDLSVFLKLTKYLSMERNYLTVVSFFG
ncbi:hypothetical protein DBV15_11322 [Temnothorax longispinosus]|uniref:ERAP1-like C-terminal domain-containing protein n=1 Tax=Temnothorax longispinosus TaxID=300112 RepID=A0A4S2JL30_9HYME|nr:hypothetical protein DBV15_11322 [Temnothorax longispinosus]